MRSRSRKRSSCASGRGNVPFSSTGFWVASTRKGRGRGWVAPSTVTWRSSMASRKLDWVRGVARLISSASTRLAKIGPGLKSKSLVRWSKTSLPVTSPGSRSGVHCTRAKRRPSAAARVRTSSVLATPGTSSISTCPSASSATSSSLTCSCLPTMTCSTAPLTSRASRSTSAVSVRPCRSPRSGRSSALVPFRVVDRFYCEAPAGERSVVAGASAARVAPTQPSSQAVVAGASARRAMACARPEKMLWWME